MGWKKISNKKIKTGIVDSNGKMIYVGSMINYPKPLFCRQCNCNRYFYCHKDGGNWFCQMCGWIDQKL